MKIRTQIMITMLLFGIILVVITASAAVTSIRVEKVGEQEKIARGIAEGAGELSYVANHCLIYRESGQLKRWESRFASFSSQVACLKVDRSEQEALVSKIHFSQERLKEVFDSVISSVGGSSPEKIALDPAFLQVSWSRMAVQSQGLISDASRLSQLLHQETEQLRETRTLLIYVMVGMLGALLLAGYMLTYRRILKSIATLQAGAAVIGSGNLDFRIDDRKKDEIGDLSHAFNRMAADLKTATASKADLEREVADRKRAEERLRQQREWLQVTLTSIGDAVIATDTEARISFLNPVAAALTGWPIEEALGRPSRDVFRIIDEETRASAEDVVSRVLGEGGSAALANHTVLIARDGREIPIEDSAAPIKDGAGNVTGVVLVFHDVTEKRRAGEALRKSEHRVRAKLDAILSPEGDIGTLDLADMIDSAGIQALMDAFYMLARIPMSILDLQGNVLVGVGWQRICTEFHRVHPETCAYCRESDLQLSAGLAPGEVRLYRCKNHMWDIATPIFIGGKHVGNVLSGQFLFEGESLDYGLFRDQARRYGFNETEYIAALEAVPRLSHEAVDTGMSFFTKLTQMLSQLSYSNLRLARLLSERDRLADSLRLSEQRLQRAQEISHLGSWELDLTRNELIWSDEVYRIFGLDPQSFSPTYEAFLDRVHPDDRAAVEAAYDASLRENRATYEIEHRVIRRSTGQVRFVHEKCEHFRDGAGRIIRSVGMVHDITDRKRSEEALQTAHSQLQDHVRRLQETNKELEGFAYTISHDLRAPLRAINGFARMLDNDYGPSLEEEARRRLAVIERNAIKMGLLIDDLLAFSRAGRAAMNVSLVDMNSLVADVVETLRSSDAGAKADIHVAGLPAAHGDPSRIRQVLANLLENAVKFSRIRSEPRIEVGSFEREEGQVYYVKDNGVGFDMKYCGKLFGVFQRLVTDHEFEGTGVGLAIVHRLVTRHGGRIWAEGKPQEGATFYFTLPGKSGS